MIDTPQITTLQPQHTAFIRLTVPHAEMGKVMGPGLQELYQALAAQGVAPAGPWFTHHLRFAPGKFDFELSLPVDRPIQAAGRVQPGFRPETKVARTVYRGGFEGLGAAWTKLDAWLAAQGHTPREDLWEVYVKGPESGAPPSGWETELLRPLAAVANKT